MFSHTEEESNPRLRILDFPTIWCDALPTELSDGIGEQTDSPRIQITN